jgi:hypothetical protein
MSITILAMPLIWPHLLALRLPAGAAAPSAHCRTIRADNGQPREQSWHGQVRHLIQLSQRLKLGRVDGFRVY